MGVARFTPETRGALIERTAAGVSLRDAATAAGVRYETVKRWLTRGRREEAGDYREFADAIDTAREAARTRPEPMTASDFRAQLERSVRSGSVTAMKLWADLFLEDGGDDQAEEDPPSPIVLLAERARRRGGPA